MKKVEKFKDGESLKFSYNLANSLKSNHWCGKSGYMLDAQAI